MWFVRRALENIHEYVNIHWCGTAVMGFSVADEEKEVIPITRSNRE